MEENFIEWEDIKKEITAFTESEKEQCTIMAQLTHILVEADYTQTELANITGMKQSAISRLLSGKIEHPEMVTLLDLLLPLGYTLKVEKKEN